MNASLKRDLGSWLLATLLNLRMMKLVSMTLHCVRWNCVPLCHWPVAVLIVRQLSRSGSVLEGSGLSLAAGTTVFLRSVGACPVGQCRHCCCFPLHIHPFAHTLSFLPSEHTMCIIGLLLKYFKVKECILWYCSYHQL